MRGRPCEALERRERVQDQDQGRSKIKKDSFAAQIKHKGFYLSYLIERAKTTYEEHTTSLLMLLVVANITERNGSPLRRRMIVSAVDIIIIIIIIIIVFVTHCLFRILWYY